MKRELFTWIVLVCSATAVAQSTRPTVKVSTDIEEGKKAMVATVTLNDKPVEGSLVQFLVRRTFGTLIVGSDTTLDDGTAAIPFPSDLPADYDGTLDVIAVIKGPAQYSSISDEAKLAGGASIPNTGDPFPRALWAPHAPLALLLTIGVLLAGVWSTYGFVVAQILAIRKEGRS